MPRATNRPRPTGRGTSSSRRWLPTTEVRLTVTDPSGQHGRTPLQPGQAPDAAHWVQDDDICGHTHDLWLCTRRPHAGDPHHEASGRWAVHAVWTASAVGGVADYRVDGH